MNKVTGNISPIKAISGNINAQKSISGNITYGVGKGETIKDYDLLINKPQIESVELQGNKTFEELGLYNMEADEILSILT